MAWVQTGPLVQEPCAEIRTWRSADGGVMLLASGGGLPILVVPPALICTAVSGTQLFGSHNHGARFGAIFLPNTDPIAPQRLGFIFGALPNLHRVTWADPPYTAWTEGTLLNDGFPAGTFVEAAMAYRGAGVVDVVVHHSLSGNPTSRISHRALTFTAGSYTLGAATLLSNPALDVTTGGLGSLVRDGSRLWIVWSGAAAAGQNPSILASFSDDNGATWAAQEIVKQNPGGFLTYDSPFLAIIQGLPVVGYHEAGSSGDLKWRLKSRVGGVWTNELALHLLGTLSSPKFWMAAAPDAESLFVIGYAVSDGTCRVAPVTVTAGGVFTEGVTELPGATAAGLAYVTMTSTANGKMYVPVISRDGGGGIPAKGIRSAAGVWVVSPQTLIVSPLTSSNTPATVQTQNCDGAVYTLTGPGAGDPNTVEVFSEAI
jgi:hypothetical protein